VLLDRSIALCLLKNKGTCIKTKAKGANSIPLGTSYKTNKQTPNTVDIHAKRISFDCAIPNEPSREHNTFIHSGARNTGTVGTKRHKLGGAQNIAASHSRAITQIMDMSCIDVLFP